MTEDYDLGYGYDDLGDLTSITDNVPATPVVQTFGHTVTGHAHAVGQVNGSPSYTYDANGATLTRPGTAQTKRRTSRTTRWRSQAGNGRSNGLSRRRSRRLRISTS